MPARRLCGTSSTGWSSGSTGWSTKDGPKPRASPLGALVAAMDTIAAWLPAITPIVLFVIGTGRPEHEQ